MLFNSYEFIFAFLPVTLLGYWWLGRSRQFAAAVAWLLGASMFFYGYWNPAYVPLLVISIAGNYGIARAIESAGPGGAIARRWLWGGVVFNLGILGYYKYAGFFVRSLNAVADTGWVVPQILLPLAISFYSFTQIAYLVDTHKGEVQPSRCHWAAYGLFVTFFPQLIAGPILRHDELLPDLGRARTFFASHRNLARGLVLFFIGLAKKVLIADHLSPWVAVAFDHAHALTFLEAWVGAIAYTLQLYFDFSGYSDMAIGLGWMFNIPLPWNFDSPYKATSIVDFWRRWHITLSNFLRDYLYIPLGGSRRGQVRRYTNLLTTMLLGGLWHGAGWTYVVWGGLHGGYLCINHAWRRWGRPLPKAIAWFLTMLAVIVSWVCFRAASLGDAWAILKAMAGFKGVVVADALRGALPWIADMGVVRFLPTEDFPYLPPVGLRSGVILAILIAGVVSLPNSRQWFERFRPTWPWLVGTGAIALAALLSLNQVSEFLYFQF